MGSHKTFLFLTLVATAAAVAHAVHPTWLPDWMNKDSSRARLASLGAETQYESEERVRGCLRLVKQKGCSCSGPSTAGYCSSQIQMLDMGCCRPQALEGDYSSQKHSDMLFSDMQGLSVGTCTWQVTYVEDPTALVEVRPNVFVRGTASFTCELNAEADKCGSPMCDGLSLTGFATIYRVDNTTGPVYTVGLVPPVDPNTGIDPTECAEEPDPRFIPGLPEEQNLPNNFIGINNPNVPEFPHTPPPIDNIGINNPNVPETPPTNPGGGEGNVPPGEGNVPPGEGNVPPGEGNVPPGEGNAPQTPPALTPPGGGKNHGNIPIVIGPPGGGKNHDGKNHGFPIVIGPPGGGKNHGGKNHGFPIIFRNGTMIYPNGTRVDNNGQQPGSDSTETVVPGPPQQTVPVQARVAVAAAAAAEPARIATAAAAEPAQYGREGGSGGAYYYPAERLNVAVGSFFVTNSRQSIRYSSGRMQYVSVIRQSATAVPVSDPAPNALVFKPFTMDLLFDSRAADTF